MHGLLTPCIGVHRASTEGSPYPSAASRPGGGPKARGSKTLWMETIFPSLTWYHEDMNTVGPVVFRSYSTQTSSPSAKDFFTSYLPCYFRSISMKSRGLPKVSPAGPRIRTLS